MNGLNTHIYDEKNNNIKTNNNFDIEQNKGPSEEEQNEFRNNLEEEKNIQKTKQRNQALILMNKLNKKNNINNSESVSKFMNDYLDFLKNLSFDDFVNSIVNDHSVFIKNEVEENAINTYMKERYNSSDFDSTKKNQKIEEIKEKLKNVTYEEKVKLYCSRLKNDNNIESMKKGIINKILFGKQTGDEEPIKDEDYVLCYKKLVNFFNESNEEINNINELNKTYMQKKYFDLQEGDFIHGTGINALDGISEIGLIASHFLKNRIHYVQGNSNGGDVSGETIKKEITKEDFVDFYNKSKTGRYGANNQNNTIGDNKKSENEEGITIVFRNIESFPARNGAEDRVSIGIPRKKIKGIIVDVRQNDIIKKVSEKISKVPFYIPIIDCNTGKIINPISN